MLIIVIIHVAIEKIQRRVIAIKGVNDSSIVDLFWERDDKALKLLDKKYGSEFMQIAYCILNNREDSEECVNDAYLNTWNSIPDAKPNSLLAYVGRIVRNLSINYLKKKSAQKRNADEMILLFSELEECIISENPVERAIDYNELVNCISIFLKMLKKEHRLMFVERYWYVKSVSDIASKYGTTTKKVESILYRTRKKLHSYLSGKGYQM